MTYKDTLGWTSVALSVAFLAILCSTSVMTMYGASWEDHMAAPCRFARDNFYQEHKLDLNQKLVHTLTFQVTYDDGGYRYYTGWAALMLGLFVSLYLKLIVFNRPTLYLQRQSNGRDMLRANLVNSHAYVV